MIKVLALILVIGGTSIYYTDMESESALASVLLPILVVISLIALALWLVTLFHNRGIVQTTHSSVDGSSGFMGDDSGGGDAG
ncbi:MAG: hypothetical protein GY896_19985 [Gammaproteobacteria bacterium]|nr:hypothetical protein [Gammaproteobacteria bacterium]MCP4979436.1 hypothetical protein [Gammaproteobacteria bacterium]